MVIYYVELDTSVVDGSNYTADDTIIIRAGARGNLTFKNFNGNGQYITIANENTNSDERVVITTSSTGEQWAPLELRDCKYVDLRGDNDPDIEYGIKVVHDGDPIIGSFKVRQKSDHIKIGYIEMCYDGAPENKVGGGLMVHDATLSETWIFDTFEIHHNYIHDVEYAGMYLGHNQPWVENDPYVANFLVHDNLLENMGCYGITLKGVHESSGVMKIYNNTIRITGVACSAEEIGATSFRSGIGTQYYVGNVYAEIYGNRIEHAAAQGITIKHGAHKVYDNLILGCGTDTIEKLEHGITTYRVDSGEIYDNIIIQPKGYGIYTLGSCQNILLYRNLVGDAGNNIGWTEMEPNSIILGTGIDANIYHADVADFGFNKWSNDGDYRNDDFTIGVSDPCEDVDCPDICVGTNLYSQKCVDGKCVTDQLLESDSINCEIPTDEDAVNKYLILGALGIAGYLMLMRNKK